MGLFFKLLLAFGLGWFLFFVLGGVYIFERLWLLIAVLAASSALISFAFLRQEDRIEALEKRLEALEGKDPAREDPAEN